MEWTDVKDQLPENRQEVLFSDCRGRIFKGIFFKTYNDKWTEYKDIFLCDSGCIHMSAYVTLQYHWMPLPSPPYESLNNIKTF